MTKRVAVIGVGAAGLTAIHQVTTADQSIDVVAFERYGEVGGVWVYTDKTGIDDDGLPVHTSMYKNVRTNIPKDCMQFFDFPYKDPFPSFMTHETLRDYLQSYADHFDLHRYIKYKTIVTRVHPVNPELRNTKWEVTYCETDDQEDKTTQVFDYVMICSGHYSAPIVNPYPGQEHFKGEIITSHDYRVPEQFSGKNVVCIGSGPSAMDITIDLDGIANKVFLSMDKKRRLVHFTLPEGAAEKTDIDHVTEHSVVFVDGSEEKVDVIILCAGYRYVYPFLTDSCKITIVDNGKRVTPLYKHMVNMEYPNMFFVGVQHFSNHFQVSDVVAQLAASVISGAVVLPSKEDMEKDTNDDLEDFLQSGMISRHYHNMPFRQFDFMDSLLEMMDKPKLPKGYRLLFEDIIKRSLTDTLTFRDLNCEVLGDTYRILSND